MPHPTYGWGKGPWRVSRGQEPSGSPQPCLPWGSNSLGGGPGVSPPSCGPGSHKGLKGDEKTQVRDDNREQFSRAAAQRPGALVLLRQRGRGRTPKARQSANQRPHGLHQLQPGSWPATHPVPATVHSQSNGSLPGVCFANVASLKQGLRRGEGGWGHLPKGKARHWKSNPRLGCWAGCLA